MKLISAFLNPLLLFSLLIGVSGCESYTAYDLQPSTTLSLQFNSKEQTLDLFHTEHDGYSYYFTLDKIIASNNSDRKLGLFTEYTTTGYRSDTDLNAFSVFKSEVLWKTSGHVTSAASNDTIFKLNGKIQDQKISIETVQPYFGTFTSEMNWAPDSLALTGKVTWLQSEHNSQTFSVEVSVTPESMLTLRLLDSDQIELGRAEADLTEFKANYGTAKLTSDLKSDLPLMVAVILENMRTLSL